MNLGRFLTTRYRNRSGPIRPVTAVTGPVPAGFFNPTRASPPGPPQVYSSGRRSMQVMRMGQPRPLAYLPTNNNRARARVVRAAAHVGRSVADPIPCSCRFPWSFFNFYIIYFLIFQKYMPQFFFQIWPPIASSTGGKDIPPDESNWR